jgi:hypothetical protein
MKPIALAAVTLACELAFAQPALPPETPVTSMRPSKHFINNSAFPRPAIGATTEMEDISFLSIGGWAGRVAPGGTFNLHADCSAAPHGSMTQFACGRNAGNFRTLCAVSHFAYDDPIVYPGQPNRSHLHMFFGNTFTKGVSTALSIRTLGNSTCSGGTLNRSAYWVPAVLNECDTPAKIADGCKVSKHGWVVKPTLLIVYYKGAYGNGSFWNDGTDKDMFHRDVAALPEGFNMIGGNAANTTEAGASGTWECQTNAQPNAPTTRHIPGTGGTAPCMAGTTELVWVVNFMSCWNGVDHTGAGGNSHLRQNSGGNDPVCPSGFQTALPGISYHIRFPVNSGTANPNTVTDLADMRFWRLSSDNYDTNTPAGYSTHGDWFNGWKQTVMDDWVINCIRAGTDCHTDLIGWNGPVDSPTSWRTLRIPRLDR